MSKRMIGTVFFGSLAAFAASLLLLALAVIVALERDVFIMSGPDVVGVRSGASSWAVLILGGLAVLLMLARRWEGSRHGWAPSPLPVAEGTRPGLSCCSSSGC